MNIYQIIIYTPNNNYYFNTEEIYCENIDKCKKLYNKKYPGYIFEIKEVI